MFRRLVSVFAIAFILAHGAAFGQSAGTAVLQDPHINPAAPSVTPLAIQNQINQSLLNKLDVLNGIATNLTLLGTPTAPTATPGTNSTAVATTA